MTTATEKLLNGYNQFNKSPGSIIEVSLDMLEELQNGLDIVDANNPFMHLMECNAVMAYAAIGKGESVAQRMYPKLANTMNDLFHHMSDKDLAGLYSTAARTEIKFLINYDQLIKNITEVVTDTTIRRAMIPAGSVVEVNGYKLSIHYGINIDIKFDIGNAASGISVYYVSTPENPMSPLVTAVVEYRTVIYANKRYLELTIPMEQFEIASKIYAVDDISTFSELVPYPDKYMYTRVYYLNEIDDVYVEMTTTMSLRVIDVINPTAVITVIPGSVRVEIPDIYKRYFTLNTIRVDVYTCKGIISYDLSNIPPENFRYSLNRVGMSTAQKKHVAVLDKVGDVVIYGLSKISGGAESKSFIEVKGEVIYRVGKHDVPILETDIIKTLDDLKYHTVKYNDNVTDRVYVASKGLPETYGGNLIRTCTPVLGNIIFNIGDEESFTYCLNRGANRTTITPNAIYKFDVGSLYLLDNTNADPIINNVDMTALADTLNNNQHYYSPFHYVLDYSLPAIKVRAYDMLNPKIITRDFVDTLISTDIIAGTYSATLECNPAQTGYILTLNAAVYPTGAIIGNGDNVDCTLNGVSFSTRTKVDGRIRFTFELNTLFDIDQNNYITFDNFGSSPISGFYDIQYSVDSAVVMNEKIELEFGKLLTGLYTPAKMLLSEPSYLKYEGDVPLLYTSTVFERDADNKLITYVEDGELVVSIKHNIGDEVKDSDGNTVYKHRAGDYVADSYGNYIVDTTGGELMVSAGLFLINAIYKFATDVSVIDFNDSIPEIIKGYLFNEIIPNDNLLNERTDLLFKPKGNLNKVKVAIGDERETFIDSNLNYEVTVFIDKKAYTNNDLVGKTINTVKNVLISNTKNITISSYDLQDKIKSALSNDIKAIDVVKFGPNKDIPIMTLVDIGDTFMIGEKMVITNAGISSVIDNIKINFIKVE